MKDAIRTLLLLLLICTTASEDAPPPHALDQALACISESFGESTAYGVALNLDYSGFQRRRK